MGEGGRGGGEMRCGRRRWEKKMEVKKENRGGREREKDERNKCC